MVVEGSTGTVDWCLEPVRQTCDFPAFPTTDAVTQWATGEGSGAVDVIHPRCAGLDISKKDAKVCVRINGAGRRKTSETVTTFGATTRQIMALRDHLAAQRGYVRGDGGHR